MSSSSSALSKSSKTISHAQSTSLLTKAKFIWRFPPSKFDSLPSCTASRLCHVGIQPINIDSELLQRQELSIFIYDLGSRVNVSFTCIYTGVVYMHRFFMLHAFQQCVKESVASACLFLACKIHEMPRPLSEFTRHMYKVMNLKQNESANASSPSPTPDITPETLSNYSQQIIEYENMLLSTLAFCLTVEQPYVIITRTSQTLSMPMEIAQKAYEMATKCIFFTHFSMKYSNNLIACFALYLAATSSQINISDNEDGSQWFHLLNEEFTEKLLRELADEYQLIYTEKCSKQLKQRFEQIRQQKKITSQQYKSKSGFPQSHSTLPTPESGPIATTSGSVRSTTSSSSSIPAQQTIAQEPGSYAASVEHYHHTPNRSSSMAFTHGDYSPSTGIIVNSPVTNSRPVSPLRQNQTTSFSGQHHITNASMSISAAKPIPTLMSSSTSFHNSMGPRHHSHFTAPVFKHPLSPPSQRLFHPAPPPPHLYHPQYPPTNYLPAATYYPPQQPPLFYHPPQDPLAMHSKRYGDPPAPPMKRFRHNTNTQQHY